MRSRNRNARINIKVVVILVLVIVSLGISLVAARQVRRTILSAQALTGGNAAFEKEDWPEASKQFKEYLGRNPDDVEILKKYAKARMAIRPIEIGNIGQTIAAYRRVVRVEPQNEDAYEQLSKLYIATGQFEELAYIAGIRLDNDPNDLQAPLWQANALIHLNKQAEAQQILQGYTDEIESIPDKRDEYVRACGLMSGIAGSEDSQQAKTKALEWLKKAVDHAPESAEALAYRARFYRVAAQSFAERDQQPLLGIALHDAKGADISSETVQDQLLALARKDLEEADRLGTQDPRIHLFLGAEWISHGELERSEAELEAADQLPQEQIEEYFLDINDWVVVRFLFASDLALRRGVRAQDISQTDDVLKALQQPRHRIRILPAAIPLYIAAGGRVSDARDCLDEYTEAILTQQGVAEPRLRRAYLQALVARAEDRLYAVIDALRPVVVNEVSRPELWRLLAEAYSRTDQSRRAISALITYLRLHPDDSNMTLQLAKEYVKLRDWNRAFDAARLAEPLDPGSIVIRLLRIESSVYIAASQPDRINTTRLAALSAELAELRKDHPKDVDIRILQAIIAVYLEQPETAEEELKLAISQCEEPLKAEIQLVRHYYRNERMDEAVSFCRAVCERHAQVAEPWLSLSGLHVAKADYDSALRCLREGLKAVTGRWETRSLSIRLALLELLHGGDQDIGIALLEDVAARDPQEVRARSLLLEIRKVREDKARAEQLVKELRDAEGESGLFWRLHEASLWLSSKEWRSRQQAIGDRLQFCMDSDPEWSAPVLLLVEMYEKLGDFKRVEQACRQALARNPSATDVADRLMTLLEKQGRFSDAENVLEQIETNPRVASAWNVRMALGARDFSRAIDELELRVRNDDRDANSRILLARLIYWQNRDRDQAFRYLSEAEAITSDSLALTAAKVSILRAESQADEAQHILDDYVANSKGFGAYMMRAEYHAGEGEFERAEQDYQKLKAFAEQGAAGYLLLSNFYVTNGKLDDAVRTLEEGLKAYPDDLGLKRSLMRSLFLRARGQDREEALAILAALEERLPEDPELMKLRAMELLQRQTPQSLQAAEKKLETVVRRAPTDIDAQLLLIRLMQAQGQYESARDYAIRAIGSNPDNPALLAARSKVELDLENTQMASQLAQLALQNDPNNPEARDVLVAVALKNKDRKLLEKARALTESVLNGAPADERLLLSRAHVLTYLQQPQTAIPELEAYCQSKDGRSNVAALATLADMYRLSGDMNRSEQWIEQAERLDPNHLSVVHGRFLWRVAQGRFEELVGISSAYLSAGDKEMTSLLSAASILSALDSMALKQEGLKICEHAVKLWPNEVDARLGLASALYQTKNAERAKPIYQALLEKHPDNIQVLNDLAWILQEDDQDYEAALELANRGLELAPGNLYLLDTRGTIQANMEGRLADARTDFETLEQSSTSDGPRQAKTLLKLGQICVKLNDLERARQYIERASEIDQKINIFTPEERLEMARIIQGSGE